MVDVFGSVETSRTTDEGNTEMVYRIPAVSSTTARARARGNNRLKGLSNPSITGIEQVDQGDAPGQKIYEVTVEADR